MQIAHIYTGNFFNLRFFYINTGYKLKGKIWKHFQKYSQDIIMLQMR